MTKRKSVVGKRKKTRICCAQGEVYQEVTGFVETQHNRKRNKQVREFVASSHKVGIFAEHSMVFRVILRVDKKRSSSRSILWYSGLLTTASCGELTQGRGPSRRAPVHLPPLRCRRRRRSARLRLCRSYLQHPAGSSPPVSCKYLPPEERRSNPPEGSKPGTPQPVSNYRSYWYEGQRLAQWEATGTVGSYSAR